jgi:hypothetical protein
MMDFSRYTLGRACRPHNQSRLPFAVIELSGRLINLQAMILNLRIQGQTEWLLIIVLPGNSNNRIAFFDQDIVSVIIIDT